MMQRQNWSATEAKAVLDALDRCQTARRLALSADELRSWLTTFSEYRPAFVLAGIKAMTIGHPDRFLDVPSIIDAAKWATGGDPPQMPLVSNMEMLGNPFAASNVKGPPSPEVQERMEKMGFKLRVVNGGRK